jgi:two-component system response regulator MprA
LYRKAWAVHRGGEALNLTATEFRLLELFMRSPEQVLTRDEILAGLWGPESLVESIESNVVDVHVANLRRKLEEGGRMRLIQTIRGVGYMLKKEG